MLPPAFYEPDGDLLIPTAATSGPWSPDAQHAGPPSALLLRAIDAAAGIAGGQIGHIVVDILRPIPLVPLRTEARVLRGGKRVEQVEAVLTVAADGTELMRARAWRLRTEAVELPGDLGEPDPPPPPPETAELKARPSFWHGDVVYWDALEWRAVHGDFEVPGPSLHWTRLRIPLIAGEATTPLQHVLVMADAASGISSTLAAAAYNFANVDYSLAFERQPEGEWQAMDAVTRPGRSGMGICTSVLSDVTGRVGTTTQTLLIAPN